jgi:flavin reductase (DIM6/NTAB) family NADH-FMN oxidoreductase RutF
VKATVTGDRPSGIGPGIDDAFEDTVGHLAPAELRQAFGRFPSAVAAVCAQVDQEPVGFVVSTFTPVSLDPPLASICVQQSSDTWPRLRTRPRLGVSLLAHAQREAGRTLALKDGDRFQGVDYAPSAGGAIFLRGAVEWIDCSIQAEMAAGDHWIVVLQLHRVAFDGGVDPLVFHSSRFWKLHDDA